MKTLFSLVISLFLLLPAAAHADISSADKAQIDAKVDTFFKRLNAGQFKEAYAEAFLPRAMDNKSQIDIMISQTETAMKFIGGPIKWSLSRQSEEADILAYRSYIAYNDDMPFRFRFIFMKTSKGWYAQSIFFTDVKIDDF